jgi:hypothetical protein
MSDVPASSLDLSERVHQFIVAAATDGLTAEIWTEFEQLLRQSDEACQLYMKSVDVSVVLPSILAAIPEGSLAVHPVVEGDISEDASSEETAAQETVAEETIAQEAVADDFDFLYEPPTASPPSPIFLRRAWLGIIGYFPDESPWPCVVATVVVALAIFVASVIPKYHADPAIGWGRGGGSAGGSAGSGSGGSASGYARQDSVPKTVTKPTRADRGIVARITGMVDCRWANPNEAPFGPNVVLGRKYALASGLMELTYDSGARVILQGPCSYEVESKTGGYLSVGKLTARVEKQGVRSQELGVRSQGSEDSKSEIQNPKSQISRSSPAPLSPAPLSPAPLSPAPLFSLPASLFCIRTPTTIITDLGTEFGLQVYGGGVTRVHVLQGAVVAERAGSPEGRIRLGRVDEGQAWEVRPKEAGFHAVTFAPRSFARELEPQSDQSSELSYMKAVLADKPLGYWPLNEPAGSRKFLDRSGSDFHGWAMHKVAAGEEGPLDGRSRAIAFGGHGYIDVGRRDELAAADALTIEAWMCLAGTDKIGRVFSATAEQKDGIAGWALAVVPPGMHDDLSLPGLVRLITYGGSYYDFRLAGLKALRDDWFHVAMVFDATNTARFFLNSEYRESVRGAAARKAEAAWVNIGGDPLAPDDCLQGRLAHVAVYPRALNMEQIRHHYTQRNATPADGGVAP